jgi:hypothetical protein
MADFVRNLPLPLFLLILAFAIAMAGVCVFAGLHARRRAAISAETSTSPLGTAEDGYRQLQGTVEAIDGMSLTSPLTYSRCCWYYARVEEFVRGGPDHWGGWQTVREVTSSAPFLVRDASGVCVVDPRDAEITPKDRSVWIGSTIEPEDRNPERYPMTDLPAIESEIASTTTHRFRYTEKRIYPGDPMLVHGSFESARSRPESEDDEFDERWDREERRTHGVYESRSSTDPWDSDAWADQLTERAESITRARVKRGDGKRPFMLAATDKGQHQHLTEVGSAAAFNVALVPLAIAALMAWIRFGN